MSATTTLPNAGPDGVRPVEEKVTVTRTVVTNDTLSRTQRFVEKVKEIAVKVRGFFGRAWRWTKNKAAALFQAGKEAAQATWDKAVVPAARWVGAKVSSSWAWLRPARSWVTTPLRAGATVAAAGFAFLAAGPGILLLAVPILAYVLVAGNRGRAVRTRTQTTVNGDLVKVVESTKVAAQKTAVRIGSVQSQDGVLPKAVVTEAVNVPISVVVEDQLHLNANQVQALTERMEQLMGKMNDAYEAGNRRLAMNYEGRMHLTIIRRAGGATPAEEVYRQFRAQVDASVGQSEGSKRYIWSAVRTGCLDEEKVSAALIEQHKETTK